MIERVDDRSDDGARLGRIGGWWGLVGGLFLASLRTFLADGWHDDRLGQIAFVAAFTIPFALVLGAARLGSTHQRAAVWLGAGMLGLPLSFLALSGVSLVLLPAAIMLLAAVWRAARASDSVPAWPILPLAAWIVVVGMSALALLFQQDDPRSYSIDGGSGWTSDIITTAEGARSLGCWAIGIAVTAATMALWRMTPGWPGRLLHRTHHSG
jgi:hypothetical protein